MISRILKIGSNPDTNQGRPIEATTAGLLLIVSAIAAVAMVWTRLQADIDQPTFEETLAAIDQNTIWYSWHGTARAFFGVSLIIAAAFIKPAMFLARGWQLRLSSIVLNLGGIAMIVSGVLVIFISLLDRRSTSKVSTITARSRKYRQHLYRFGHHPAEMAIGFHEASGLLAPFVGIGMILVWIDAATILHRISGTGFLIWLLGNRADVGYIRFAAHQGDAL